MHILWRPPDVRRRPSSIFFYSFYSQPVQAVTVYKWSQYSNRPLDTRLTKRQMQKLALLINNLFQINQ